MRSTACLVGVWNSPQNNETKVTTVSVSAPFLPTSPPPSSITRQQPLLLPPPFLVLLQNKRRGIILGFHLWGVSKGIWPESFGPPTTPKPQASVTFGFIFWYHGPKIHVLVASGGIPLMPCGNGYLCTSWDTTCERCMGGEVYVEIYAHARGCDLGAWHVCRDVLPIVREVAGGAMSVLISMSSTPYCLLRTCTKWLESQWRTADMCRATFFVLSNAHATF